MAFVGIATIIVGIAQRAHVDITVDGLRVAGSFGATRLVPFHAIERVEHRGRDATLLLDGGERLSFHASRRHIAALADLVANVESEARAARRALEEGLLEVDDDLARRGAAP